MSKRNDTYTLSLYGNAESNEMINEFISLVQKLKLEGKIFFLGLVSRNIITVKLLEASILVLPRPDSIQAQYGFSTKFGEYLATGNPVVATSVGEIPKYLTDKKNVFLALPDDVGSLEEKLSYIIENYDLAKNVAESGRLFAEKHFDNLKQTEAVLSIIRINFK